MPTKDSACITVRFPQSLVDAIKEEARERRVSVTRLLHTQLMPFYLRGHEVRKSDKNGRSLDDNLLEDDEE